MENLKRRGLSGMYVFDTFPGETKRQPTCIEDCQEETRKKYLSGQEREFLVNTIEILCRTIRDISDQFGIIATDEENINE